MRSAAIPTRSLHPSFFSWANVKTLFYRSELRDSKQVVHILRTNYRNSGEITASAYNRHLFARMSHGYYVLNPLLAIKSGEQWISIYDHLNLPLLYEGVQESRSKLSATRYFLEWLIKLRAQLLGNAPPNEEEE
ncbi:MAG: hypothetical protein HC889_17645 [Synechococcaceae cyanobacterium SM1_2_3]|nr:hypothetical protein [Synechococcaceae cyanobacterium SM1_2_3]